MLRSDLARATIATIQRYGRTGWGRTRCPFCIRRVGSEDRRGSFGHHRDSGRWHCFRCSAGGWIDGDRAYAAERPLPELSTCEPPEGFVLLHQGSELGALPARAFAARRAIGVEALRDAKIGACLAGQHYGRIVIPVLAGDGATWRGWVGRWWTQKSTKQPKYYNTPGMSRDLLLYNGHVLGEETDRPALVVEGVFDALPYWPDAVAVLGKPSEGQIQLLAASQRPLVWTLDGDSWEESEFWAIRTQMEGARSSWLRLPPKQDPSSLAEERGPEWLWERAMSSV